MSNLVTNGNMDLPNLIVAEIYGQVPTGWTSTNANVGMADFVISQAYQKINKLPSNITQFFYFNGASIAIYRQITFPSAGIYILSFYTSASSLATWGLTATLGSTTLTTVSYTNNAYWYQVSASFSVSSSQLSQELRFTATTANVPWLTGVSITLIPIFDNSANAMTANYRNGLIFNSQFLVNNNSSFNSQQNNHSLDFISDQYYGEGYQNMTVAFSSTQNRIPIYRSIVQPATFSRTTNFSASYLNGCFLWLDAADLYTINLTTTAVNSWSDKSSSSLSLAQAGVVGLKPIYTANSLNGRSTLVFTRASTQYLLTTSTQAIGTNSFAMFVVCKFNNLTDGVAHSVFVKSYYGVQDGRFGLFKTIGNKILAFLHHGTVISPDQVGFTITSTGYNIYSFVCNRVAGNDTVYYNGISQVTRSYVSDIATNLTNTNDFIVGAYNSATGSGVVPTATENVYLDGGVAEIMCFRTPTDMTEATRQKIEGYLAWKWGLTANLPLHHPWIYDQPTFGLQS